MNRLFMGVDIGTHETKGILIDETFRPVAEHAVPHRIENPQPGLYEMDARIWWSDFCQVTRALIGKAAVGPIPIAGVGVSVMGCDCKRIKG